MIHQWKRFGKQIQKAGNLSGNISTPSWSIHWTRRAGIVSRPPRAWLASVKSSLQMGRGRSKGAACLRVTRSPNGRQGGSPGWKGIFNAASGTSINSCKHKFRRFSSSLAHNAYSSPGSLIWSTLKYFYWGTFLLTLDRAQKMTAFTLEPRTSSWRYCSVLSSPQAQLVSIREVQPFSEPCQCWRGLENRTSQTLAAKKANIKATRGLN